MGNGRRFEARKQRLFAEANAHIRVGGATGPMLRQ
jgi:hypothetical protein